VHGDRDGRLAVGDVVAGELATEIVRQVLDGYTGHTSIFEHVF
jgi:hypothetical protein